MRRIVTDGRVGHKRQYRPPPRPPTMCRMNGTDITARSRRYAIGCVSFLNARPLIDGLDGHEELDVRYDVPSRLLEDLLSEQVDVALCPVVDYQASPVALNIVPVGGIGCDGPTLTVRLFSQVPFSQVQQVHADPDSHTSVILTQLVLHDLYGVRAEMVDLPVGAGLSPEAQTLLLIGDKVVRSAPADALYPHQLDLGRAWRDLTGLPFVFAVWMSRAGTDLGPVPTWLDEQRRINAGRVDEIVARHAEAAGFPRALATTYLGRLLRYQIGPQELAAMERFWRRAHDLELLPRLRPLEVISPTAPAAR
jgi:chorismate dehydratase